MQERQQPVRLVNVWSDISDSEGESFPAIPLKEWLHTSLNDSLLPYKPIHDHKTLWNLRVWWEDVKNKDRCLLQEGRCYKTVARVERLYLLRYPNILTGHMAVTSWDAAENLKTPNRNEYKPRGGSTHPDAIFMRYLSSSNQQVSSCLIKVKFACGAIWWNSTEQQEKRTFLTAHILTWHSRKNTGLCAVLTIFN